MHVIYLQWPLVYFYGSSNGHVQQMQLNYITVEKNECKQELQMIPITTDRLYLVLRRDFKMAVPQRETTPKLLGGNVCSIFYSHILLDSAD